MSNEENKKIYFTPGPAKVPAEVMKQVHDELLNYNNLEISVIEMSHRSKEFEAIIVEAEANLRKLLNVPDNYAILFMHGGANSQFDSIALNLCSELDKCTVDYIVTGTWSSKAAKEAAKYANVVKQDMKINGKYERQAEKSELRNIEEAAYRFYCDNETIQGVEFNYVPETNTSTKIPLVSDMTSNFLTRPVDVSKFGCIFAGAQKNCGVAGLALVIVRKDLIGKQMRITPVIQNYQIMHENRSLFNTPLTFNIYVANLCFKWILERGGLEGMEKFSKEKSRILYDLIDNSQGFYTNPVPRECRSRTNVVFLLGNKELELKFLEESKANNLYELKGHRSVGGLRASLYHGVTVNDVKQLAKFMLNFKAKYSN